MDMVHVSNAVDAHLLAEKALTENFAAAGGKAYFITNGEPVVLWDWINGLLEALGEPRIERHVPLAVASSVGALCEMAWRVLSLKGEPPMTRFVASELAKDHWFEIAAARSDLGYSPRVTMEAGTRELVESLISSARSRPPGRASA